MSDGDLSLSILIVTFNSAEHIDALLDSIAAHTTVAHEVIVVDNASTDGTAELLAARGDDVQLVASPENLGFAKGVNTAAARAAGEFVVLLNPDTRLDRPALDALVDFARAHPDHGLYGGRTVDEHGGVDPSSCWGPMTPWSLTCFALGLTTIFKRSAVFDPESMGRWDRDTVREVGVVTGCLALARRSVWEELGGLDERFWMYGEDADLSYRARSAGYRPVISPDAEIFHAVGASSSTRYHNLEMVYRGKATLIRLHFAGWRRPYGLLMLRAGIGLRAAGAAARAGLKRSSPSDAPYVQMWRSRGDWVAGY
ncbi:MAG: glycosyltransferase family 2 protein [Acidimicrobiales bacterium]